MSDKNLRELMDRLKPEELIRIANSGHDDGFSVDVVAAAKAELSYRQIDPESWIGVEGSLVVSADIASQRDLPTGFAIACLVLSPILIGAVFPLLLMFYGLSVRGYRRMANQAFNALALGFALYVGVGLLCLLAMTILG